MECCEELETVEELFEEQSLLRLLRFLVDTLYGRADVMLNSARNAP